MISFFSCTGKANKNTTKWFILYHKVNRYYSQQIHTFSHAAKYETLSLQFDFYSIQSLKNFITWGHMFLIIFIMEVKNQHILNNSLIIMRSFDLLTYESTYIQRFLLCCLRVTSPYIMFYQNKDVNNCWKYRSSFALHKTCERSLSKVSTLLSLK